MSDKITDFNMIHLREALQQAALPAERQIARLKGFDVPFEVVDDVGHSSRWVLQSTDVELSDEQRSSLIALDALTDEMNHNADLWNDDALRSRPEWDEVRRQARKILELFQWCPGPSDVDCRYNGTA
jgi:hypothetical protein